MESPDTQVICVGLFGPIFSNIDTEKCIAGGGERHEADILKFEK